MNNQLNEVQLEAIAILKRQLKTSIDDTLKKIDNYNRVVALLNLPELPPELIEFGDDKYNVAIALLDGLEKTE